MSKPTFKTDAEIEAMRPASEITAQALKLMEEMVAPGVTTLEIDQAVEALIRKAGGIPAFLGYPSHKSGVSPFPASICASINEEVVHGIPCDRRLREGDIFSVDVGVEFDGWFGDAARTFAIGSVSRKAQKLIDVTRNSLEKATALMKEGVLLNKVSGAVQQEAEAHGFSVVKDFVGHGIGREMHEAPQVPNYASRLCRDGSIRLKKGLALAIEPMVNTGSHAVRVQKDGWTVVTKDRGLSAHFENTIVVGKDGPIVLTA